MWLIYAAASLRRLPKSIDFTKVEKPLPAVGIVPGTGVRSLSTFQSRSKREQAAVQAVRMAMLRGQFFASVVGMPKWTVGAHVVPRSTTGDSMVLSIRSSLWRDNQGETGGGDQKEMRRPSAG